MKQCEKFLIIANDTKDVGLEYTGLLAEIIKNHGGTATVISGGDYSKRKIDQEVMENADCAVIMGGDGTMLRASHSIEDYDIPLIGENLGTVGFLAEVTKEGMETMVSRMTAGDYKIEERIMLSGSVHRCDEIIADDLQALNDAVIARESALRLITVKIYVNGHFFDEIEGDGIIIATPTGSTGYNLSAGGPIVNPGASLLLMTPISPYSMCSRSVVFGAEDEIALEFIDKRKNGMDTGLMSFDGISNVIMKVGDIAKVRVSDKSLKFIKLDNSSVYQKLRRKLGG